METPNEYRKSKTYRKADAAGRKVLEQYKKEQKLTDEQMAWQMYLQDLRDMPKEERQKGNRAAEGCVIGAMILFLIAIQSRRTTAMLIASITVIASTIVYVSGVLNPYTASMRRAKKQLKKECPKALTYRDWTKKDESGKEQ